MKNKEYDKNNRQFLLDNLNDILKNIPVMEVYFATNTPLPGYPAINYPRTRIIIPLSGNKLIKFACEGNICEKVLTPGELLFSRKNCWALPEWNSRHSMLSVVFANGNSYIRVIYIDNDGTHDQYGPDIWYHTACGLDGARIHLLQSLDIMSQQPGSSSTRSAALLTEALLIASRDILEHDNPKMTSKSQRTFMNVKQYLHDNCSRGINRNIVASELNLNPSYLSRLFKRFAGESFNSYLTEMRMKCAVQLLEIPTIQIDEISRQCGFSDTGYFIKLFKRHFGTTPGRYKSK